MKIISIWGNCVVKLECDNDIKSMKTINVIGKYLGWAFTTIMIVMIVNKLYNDYLDENEIESNKGEIYGEIVDYYIVGTASPYIAYSYVVNAKEYKNVRSTFSAFIGCEKSRKCLGRKFKVYYSKKNPQKSILNLDDELKTQVNEHK